jgi:hypothetical protein
LIFYQILDKISIFCYKNICLLSFSTKKIKNLITGRFWLIVFSVVLYDFFPIWNCCWLILREKCFSRKCMYEMLVLAMQCLALLVIYCILTWLALFFFGFLIVFFFILYLFPVFEPKKVQFSRFLTPKTPILSTYWTHKD